MTPIHSNLTCRKCRVPFEYHSTQTSGGPNILHHVAVFECRQCGRLIAEEIRELKAA